MISVVIEAPGDDGVLGATLASLVEAAAEGFVRDVVVACRGAPEGVRRIADAMGCEIVEGGRREALGLVRSDWILVLAPGVRLEPGWFHEAAMFIERARRSGRTEAAIFRQCVDDYGPRARLAGLWLALRSRLGESQVLLAPRSALADGRRLRTTRLRSRAYVGALASTIAAR
jgi:hypothetical protein